MKTGPGRSARSLPHTRSLNVSTGNCLHCPEFPSISPVLTSLQHSDQNLSANCTEFPLTVSAPGDFSVAMVTRGGVALEHVNPKTMESKIVPDLYFAGEVLDIDGDTGGYNIQAAFSTGFLAAVKYQETMGARVRPGGVRILL